MLAPAKRWIALGAIVVTHGASVYVVELCLAPSQIVQAPKRPPLIVSFIQESTPEPQPSQRPWRPPMGGGKQTLPVPTVPFTGEASGAITDWHSEARTAVQESLRRQTERSRQRSFEHQFPAPAAPVTGGVFGSDKADRRAGTVEDGENFWVTDDCYFDFPRGPPAPHMTGQFELLTPVCKPPPQGGGGNMLEALTPDYLKRAPER